MRQVSGFGWLLVVVVSFFFSVSQGAVVVKATASVGPPTISSTSYGIYTIRVLECLATGAPQVKYPAPLSYGYSFAPDQLRWGDITVDNSGHSVWLGEIVTDPISPFYGEKGTAFYVNAVFAGDGVHKFSTADIGWQVSSTDPAHSLSASGTLAGLNYGTDPVVGIDYGADGVRSLDDIYYNFWNPASGDVRVDMILYVGVAVAYDATDVGLGYVRDYIEAVGPFDLTITYSVNDRTGIYESYQTRTVVPEPTTLALLGLGAVSSLTRRRSR